MAARDVERYNAFLYGARSRRSRILRTCRRAAPPGQMCSRRLRMCGVSTLGATLDGCLTHCIPQRIPSRLTGTRRRAEMLLPDCALFTRELFLGPPGSRLDQLAVLTGAERAVRYSARPGRPSIERARFACCPAICSAPLIGA